MTVGDFLEGFHSVDLSRSRRQGRTRDPGSVPLAGLGQPNRTCCRAPAGEAAATATLDVNGTFVVVGADWDVIGHDESPRRRGRRGLRQPARPRVPRAGF